MLMILPNGELKDFNSDELYDALNVYLLGITELEVLDENAIPVRSLTDCALSVAEQIDYDFGNEEETWEASEIWEIADDMIHSEVVCYLSLEPTESFSEWMIGYYEINWEEVLA